jgi:hypothetical protein
MSGMTSLDRDRIWKYHGCCLLLDCHDFIKADDKSVYPTKNVAGEANVAFGYVDAASKDDLPLQSTTVVLD